MKSQAKHVVVAFVPRARIPRPFGRMKSLIPPPNYGAVIPARIFRSGFPEEDNQTFLQTLKLKTVL